MSQSGISANSDILSILPGPRLAMLEAANVARRYSVETSLLRRNLDRLAARVENRFIERILISRLKFLRSGRPEALRQPSCILPRCAVAIESGALETLPSFTPRGGSARGAWPPRPADHSDRGRHGGTQQACVALCGRRRFHHAAVAQAERPWCSRLAEAIDCEIMLVAHRLAPEHPFPAAPTDFAGRYRGLIERRALPGRHLFCSRHRRCVNRPRRPAIAATRPETLARRHGAVFALV